MSVTVDMQPAGPPDQTPPASTEVLTKPAVVARLTSIVDHLPVYAGPVVINCPAYGVGAGVSLRFSYRGDHAQTIMVRESAVCPHGTVHLAIHGETYPILSDPALSLAKAVGYSGA